MVLHVNKGQQMISLDQLGILGKDLPQLDGCHVLMSVPAKSQGIVVFPNGLVDGVQLVGVRLKTIDIFVCNISGRLQILADHPLAKCRNHLSGFKINKSQQISRLYVPFVKGKALLQTVNGS